MVFIGFGGRRRRGYGGGFDRGYGGRYDRGYRRGGGGGGCARDACLLEGGCCLAESLDGNCLLALLLSLPQVLALLVRPTASGAGSPAQRAVLAAVGRYRRDVSPRRLRPVCRFTPSCSLYAEQAVRRHGAGRGTWLAARRLLRCRPGAGGGADPVPAAGC